MQIARTEKEYAEILKPFKDHQIGFVPTMGALHDGHLSLIKESKQKSDLTVCSIFINPTQFNNQEDLEKYPRTEAEDIQLLEAAGCDILFLPSIETMYPDGVQPKESYRLGNLEQVLEGAYRPGHFQGVAQVVDRLLQIIQPNYLFMGEKDWQQTRVIATLLANKFSKNPIQLMVEPTVRESSGLAKSSRNMRLNKNALESATTIYACMKMIEAKIKEDPIAELIEKAKMNLLEAGFEKIDYVSVAEANTLDAVKEIQSEKEYRVLVAAFIDGIRLIDNMALKNIGVGN